MGESLILAQCGGEAFDDEQRSEDQTRRPRIGTAYDARSDDLDIAWCGCKNCCSEGSYFSIMLGVLDGLAICCDVLSVLSLYRVERDACVADRWLPFW
jgi:hypothetical protein